MSEQFVCYDKNDRAGECGFSRKVRVAMPTTTDKLADRVRAGRVDLGWNQSALAKAVGVNRSFICRIEKGTERPTVETLRKLADVLGKSLDWLVGRDIK